MSSGSYIDAARTKQMKDLLGVRHIQAVLLAGALFVNHIQQSNVAITAVAITSHNPNITYWQDGKVRARGSFFYSLIISCLVGGYLTTKFDIKIMLLCSTVVGTITTYLTPTLVKYYNWQILIVIRILHGSSKGFIRPLVYSQLVRWLPPDELMLMGPVVLSSLFLGYGLIEMMGGYLSSGQGGWPSIFYFSGNIGFIWCLAYLGLGSQSPNACFYISVYEKRYIEESLPSAIRLPYRKYIPLKKILTCVPLYALIISQSANNYALQTFVKIVPLFYENSLQLDVQKVNLELSTFLCTVLLLKIIMCVSPFIALE
ncbi:unnamed protein product [Nezara viridula]|uniref:Major facilitator superfamily (MFS) profile domain-containing protein n=1 Tax=Nezara viridula TaxID=85310 RepID=A0A9P0MMW8_NEZVI|nr:unnamed protein product [Nezara viridula]